MEYVVRFASEIGLSKAQTSDLLMRLNLLPGGRTRHKGVEFLSLDLVSGDDAKRQRRAVEEFEARASAIRVFDSQGIPVLLQTEEYTRSVVRLSGVPEPGPGELLVRARLKRQKEARKKELLVVLTEGALRARVSSYPEMVSQVNEIKSCAGAQNCRLGIIAWNARLTATVPPAFEIYDDTLVCIELPHGKLCLAKEKETQIYLRVFDSLEKTAVVGKEALAVLDRIVQDFKRLHDLERSANAPTI
jgi:hypothetical protein